jgi:hypothetical protein
LKEEEEERKRAEYSIKTFNCFITVERLKRRKNRGKGQSYSILLKTLNDRDHDDPKLANCQLA